MYIYISLLKKKIHIYDNDNNSFPQIKIRTNIEMIKREL